MTLKTHIIKREVVGPRYTDIYSYCGQETFKGSKVGQSFFPADSHPDLITCNPCRKALGLPRFERNWVIVEITKNEEYGYGGERYEYSEVGDVLGPFTKTEARSKVEELTSTCKPWVDYRVREFKS